MEKSKLKITTKAQFERLVKLMENKPEISKGKQKFGMTKNQYKEAWEGFSIELNSLGPPTRTPSEWQRVWIHYKASVKKKLANNKKNYQATGGGPSQEIPLNNLEDCVSQLLSLSEQIAPSGHAFGVENITPTTSRASVSPQDPELEEINPNVSEALNTPAKKKRKPIEQERLELLRKQCETQAKLLKSIRDLEKTAYKNYEIKKKELDIKQRKIALYERQVNEATELHKLKVECEKMKILKLKHEVDMAVQKP